MYHSIASVLCFGDKACGLLAPRPGIESTLKGEVSTTGPRGMSLEMDIFDQIFKRQPLFQWTLTCHTTTIWFGQTNI